MPRSRPPRSLASLAMRHQALEDLRHPLIPMAPSPTRQLHSAVAFEHRLDRSTPGRSTVNLASNEVVRVTVPVDALFLWHPPASSGKRKSRIRAPGAATRFQGNPVMALAVPYIAVRRLSPVAANHLGGDGTTRPRLVL